MSKSHYLNLLINNLLNLYHQLGIHLFGIRNNLYHKVNIKNSRDIHKTITNNINKLATNSIKQTSDTIEQKNSEKFVATSDKKLIAKNHPGVILTGEKTHNGQNFIKKYSLDTNATLGEQLIKNTWQHIHNAIRYARQGKKTEAKLHAELANNALKEAAHFMSEEDYLKFTSEIELEINRVIK